jgi:hypothetical protein
MAKKDLITHSLAFCLLYMATRNLVAHSLAFGLFIYGCQKFGCTLLAYLYMAIRNLVAHSGFWPILYYIATRYLVAYYLAFGLSIYGIQTYGCLFCGFWPMYLCLPEVWLYILWLLAYLYMATRKWSCALTVGNGIFWQLCNLGDFGFTFDPIFWKLWNLRNFRCNIQQFCKFWGFDPKFKHSVQHFNPYLRDF